MNHARIRPSSAARIVQCTGSLKMEAAQPEPEDTEATLEGTFAHAVARAMQETGEILPGATDEMIDGAQIWCDTIAQYGPQTWHFEEYCAFPHIHEQNGGTPDAWCLDEHGTLHILDYKFGYRHVEVIKNWQCINYAGGLAEGRDVKHAELVIVQPRDYHSDGAVRRWLITINSLNTFADVLATRYERALSPAATLDVGPECRDCIARFTCPALRNAALDACDMPLAPLPLNLPVGDMAKELARITRSAMLLEARRSGLESELTQRAKQGQQVPGWRLKEVTGRLKWTRPISEVVALGDMMGVSLAKPDALTPRQAIKAGLSEDLISQYAGHGTTGVALTQDDTTDSQRVFGGQS